MIHTNDEFKKRIPNSLIQHLNRGKCILFAGSGLSTWGKLPTWEELLEILVEKVEEEYHHAINSDELKNLLQLGRLLEVADYCSEKLGKRLKTVILPDQLRSKEFKIPEPHRSIVNLNLPGVVTTNYDLLIEQAYVKYRNFQPRIPTNRDIAVLGLLLFQNDFFVLKAHGDIDHPDSLILTTRDYREIIHSNPAFNLLFSAILLTNAVLFIGYSMRDPDFRLLLENQLSAFNDVVPERYALMSGLSDIECELLKRNAGIHVIPYENNDEVLLFIKTLEKLQSINDYD